MDYNQFISKYRTNPDYQVEAKRRQEVIEAEIKAKEALVKPVKVKRVKHELIIKSLHDAKLECTCGQFHYSYTGAITEIQAHEIFDVNHKVQFEKKTI